MRTLSLLALAVLSLSLPVVAFSGANDGYVACMTSETCVPFDVNTYSQDTPIDLLPDAGYAYDCTMKPDGSEIWISGGSGDGIVVIDTATNLISHSFAVGEHLNSIVFSDDSSFVMVGSRDDDVLYVVDTATYAVINTLPCISGAPGTYTSPGQLALDPVSKNIYAVDWYGKYLYEIAEDGSHIIQMVEIGHSLWQLVVDPDGDYIYVTDRGTDQVRVIDQATLAEVTAIDVGDDPWGIDVTLDGSRIVVACEDDSNVYVIDTSDWSTTVVFLEQYADPRDVDILDSEGFAFIAGGTLLSAVTKVYIVQLSDNTLKDSFVVAGGTNANCLAVQPQITSDSTGVPEGSFEPRVRLECYPNPLNPKTTIRYSLPSPSVVSLSVYDVSGRLVTVLEEGERSAGDHEITWLGRDSSGDDIATGVYFVKLMTEDGGATARVVLLK
ncbi:T9SS type A sorting domain-containing protein [bacterium]|nr:T9SS type A sorting domain-containing protein [bacterium]